MAYFELGPNDTSRMVSATDKDDIIVARTTGHQSDQVHIYAHRGDDIITLDMTNPIRSTLSQGFHVYGNAGADQFRFVNFDKMNGTISGRIDDFNPTEDQIYIDGQLLDIYNPGAITGYKVSVIEFVQPPKNNYGITASQQWLRIETPKGQALYALEGARLLSSPVGDATEESHFISHESELSGHFTTVTYTNPFNFIPSSMIPVPEAGFVDRGRGTGESDLFAGTEAAEKYDASRGNDAISGFGGNDTLNGYFGDDSIYGGTGDDYIEGEKGRDFIYGGAGNDVISGGTDNDIINGNAGNDYIYGGTEDDTLSGDAGNDTIDGSFGDDVIKGGSHDDYLLGKSGNDILWGEAGNDSLVGGTGDDVLRGGIGIDTMSGGAGADLFEFSNINEAGINGATRDIILDFQRGVDKIDLSLIDANLSASGNQAFMFSGSAARANSVWWVTSGTSVLVRGDNNGDGTIDFVIELRNTSALSASDFIL